MSYEDATANPGPSRTVVILLCVVCAVVSGRQVVSLGRQRAPCGTDGRSRYHQRMQPLQGALGGAATAGYLGDEVGDFPGLPRDEVTGLFWAQHHALPTILRRDGSDALVVVNFHGADAAEKAIATGWRVEREFGNGLYLMRR